jgi:hypothetical protein
MAGNTKYSHFKSNGSMLDLFLLLAMSFAVLFVIAFILIKPVDPKQKDVDLEEHLMIKLEWDDEKDNDLDLWIRTPTGEIVSYQHKDNGHVVLERDDLGTTSDWVYVNGELQVVKSNLEVARVKRLSDGTYYISVHYFSPHQCLQEECALQTFKITVYDGQKHKQLAIYTGEVTMYGETPVIQIHVKDGKILGYESSTMYIASRNRGPRV